MLCQATYDDLSLLVLNSIYMYIPVYKDPH